MSTFKIIIPYKPMPKASVRYASKGFYNPSAKGMAEINRYVKRNFKGPLMEGPLLVVAHFLMPLPCSYKGDRRKGRNKFPHMIKPDGDNLEKLLNDSLKGALWKDDSQISVMLRTKTYTDHKVGGTILYVAELPDLPFDIMDIDDHLFTNLIIEDIDHDNRPS